MSHGGISIKSNYKKVMLKYFMLCGSFGVACIIIWLVACFTLQSYISKIVILLSILLISKILIKVFANKTIASVLYLRLDATLFNEVINSKKILPPLEYRIDAALFTGDYQTVVDIAVSQIKKRIPIRVKYIYLCVLACVYFEIRDFKKLQKLLTEYDNFKIKYSSKSFLNQPMPIWSYYRSFLEHDYQSCKTLCRERNLVIKPNSWDSKLLKLKNDFLYAVACYQNQEYEEARNIFNSIILYAPKIYLSNVSEKYLVAIEQGCDSALSFDEILPQSDYQIYDNKTKKRIRNHKLITSITFCIGIILLISSIPNFLCNESITSFEKKLNQAVSEQYRDAVVIDYFNLYKEETFIDALGIVLENNGVHLVEIVSSDEGKTIDISLIEEDIELDKYYCVKSPASNYYIGFVLSNFANLGADAYCVREFTVKSDRHSFIVDYIERWPNGDKGTALLSPQMNNYLF